MRLTATPGKRRKVVYKQDMAKFDLETKILKFGLNSDPSSVNVIAKRLRMSESTRNLNLLKGRLERMFSEKKVYMVGTRYAIDYVGAKLLMESLGSTRH